MSKEMKMASSSNHDDDSSDEGGTQLHGGIKMKNVLYYKKHSKSARPTRGKLLLGQKNISFQSKGLDYCWNLDSICVEKFKGRVNGGMKILGKRQMGEEDEEEFIFTMVKQSSYDLICNSIDDAKFDGEMNRVRKASMHAVAKNGVSLSTSLSAVRNEREGVQTKRSSLLLKPFQFILLVIFKIVSFVYKMCTGRRLWGPKNMHDALHGVLTKISPILTVSKMTLSKRRVMAIEKDINAIHESLLKISRVVRRQQSEYFSHGSITVEDSGSFSTRMQPIISAISFFLFSIMRILNLPKFHLDLRLQPPNQYPSTVSEAVQNANDQLVALMELAVNETYSSVDIIGESKRIQLLLYNIRVHETVEMSPAGLSEKEEESKDLE